jgi:selenocysteine-specific elongation factor
MVDVRLQHLENSPRPLKNRAKIRFHTGTSEIIGTLILLDTDELKPGASGYAQVRLDKQVVVRNGDRFVLRSYSPMHTLGGGQILHPIPKKRKRMVAETLEALAVLERGEPEEMVELYLREAGTGGVDERALSILANVSQKELRGLLQAMMSRGEVIQFDRETPRFVHREALENLRKLLLGYLEEFHRLEPLRAGINKEELFGRLPREAHGKLFNELIQRLTRQGEIIQEKDLVRLSSHQIALAGKQDEVREKIESIYHEAGLQPPFFREVAQSLGVPDREARQILSWMLEQGLLIKVKEDMYFHCGALDELKQKLLALFEEQEEISTPQFKELTQTSRKYTIPLLEFLDASRFTIRVGDVRRLRQKKQPA